VPAKGYFPVGVLAVSNFAVIELAYDSSRKSRTIAI
jgi:hypothetical protein